MVGSALVRRLAREDCEVLTVDRQTIDLKNQAQTNSWIQKNRPDAIFVAAAKVGGILANDSLPAEFLYNNMMIEANIIEAAHQAKVQKLLFLGSSCIYPTLAHQPITEDALLTGPLEPTNEWYAIAKIAGIKLCQAYRKQYGCDFISAMPTNLYGAGDNFDPNTSHVLPALIRKAHEAKIRGASSIMMWGSGAPRREFLYADDAADALVFLMQRYSDFEHVNVGSGDDMTILELAKLICSVVGFEGGIAHDISKPNGTSRKLMSGKKLKSMGWSLQTGFEEGISTAYAAFLESEASATTREIASNIPRRGHRSVARKDTLTTSPKRNSGQCLPCTWMTRSQQESIPFSLLTSTELLPNTRRSCGS